MAFFDWSKEYQVDVEQIDAEHHHLFDLINEYYIGHARRDSDRDIARLLSQLVAYAEEHFEHEERLMSDIGYPPLEEHKAQHTGLITAIFEIKERLSTKSATADAEILAFVKSWLTRHILEEDIHIGDFIRKKNKQ